MENERISQLLARKLADALTVEEEKELEMLLQQYPYASYTREVLMQPWKDTQAVPDGLLERHMSRLEQAPEEEKIVSLPAKSSKRWPYIAAAASVALLIAAAWQWWPVKHPLTAPVAKLEHLQTQPRMRSRIVLPDGSKVWLNAGSKLDYPQAFGNHERVVTLEGEAFFDITKDAARPFRVKTAAFYINVLGTTFNVRAYPHEDSAVTALVQGAVEVVIKDNVIPLQPNEKLVIPVVEPPIAKTEKEKEVALTVTRAPLTTMRDSIITETAWVQNKLAFKHMSLENVARMMEQWYGAEIRFKNDRKRQLYFSGVFEKESLEQALHVLEMTTLSFRYTKDASGTIWIE